MYAPNSLTDPSLAVPYEGKGLSPDERKVSINAFSGEIVCEKINVRGSINSANPPAPLTFGSDVSILGNLNLAGSITQPVDTLYENSRKQNPNSPETFGTSRSAQAASYTGYPFQAGSVFGTGLKLDVDSGLNKASVSGLDVSLTFDLVPSSAEAGAMDSEIVSAGFVGPFAARANNWSWYGATCDDTNFYYQVNGGPGTFASIFGFGTNSLFVCRRKSNASLVWVKDCRYYDIVIRTSVNFAGSNRQPARTALAIHRDRLYATSMLTNVGPQLYCIDKNTGERIWTMLYDVPAAAGGGTLVTPSTPYGSVDPAPFIGSNLAVGDLNIVVKELSPALPSIFVGISSYQNAANTEPIWGNYTDQGKLIRVDDMSTTAARVWIGATCVQELAPGDVITAGGPPTLDPFRPGQTEVLIWRNSPAGTFADAGGVIGKVLDNTGPHPGYRPMGYTGPGTTNNLTMPAMYGRSVSSADLPLTEASFNSLFRSPSPGVGASARVYQRYNYARTNIAAASNGQTLPQATINVDSTAAFATTGSFRVISTAGVQLITYTGKTAGGFTGCAGGTGTLGTRAAVEYPLPTTADTITNVLASLNTALPTVVAGGPTVVYLWCYLTGAEITAVDGAAAPFLAANVGTRYMAALPTPYTLANAQEAKELNYYGNSVWSQTPVIDLSRGLVYCGTGQAHHLPADEELYFQDPAIDYRERVRPLVDAMYRYTQDDATLAGAGPFESLTSLNAAKDAFCTAHRGLCLAATAMSPRGQRCYSDATVGFDLVTGALEFGIRTLPSDIANFNQKPTAINNTVLVGPDADNSSGIQLFESVRKSDGKLGQFLSSCNKGGLICNIDISGLNRAVPWDHNNALTKGLDPKFAYGGSLSALGGSNYGSCQSGGQYLIYMSHNASTDVSLDLSGGSGVKSNVYTANSALGWEAHVTRDGRVYQLHDSVIAAYDVGKGEIVWEENIGQLSFGYPMCYNGVVFMCTTEGLLVGYDVADGHKVFSRDVAGLGLGGITPPVFDNGVGYAVCNYVAQGHGKLGNKGLILKVTAAKIIPAGATVASLLVGTFTSYDVIPKKAPIAPQDFPLIEPEAISHVWTGAECVATHTPTGGAPTGITVTADKYNAADRIVTLVDSGTVTSVLRYVNIEMLNTTDYVLFYQRLISGVWTGVRATFKKV